MSKSMFSYSHVKSSYLKTHWNRCCVACKLLVRSIWKIWFSTSLAGKHSLCWWHTVTVHWNPTQPHGTVTENRHMSKRSVTRIEDRDIGIQSKVSISLSLTARNAHVLICTSKHVHGNTLCIHNTNVSFHHRLQLYFSKEDQSSSPTENKQPLAVHRNINHIFQHKNI